MNQLPVIEADVIIALRNGDERAFRQIYDAYHSRLYQFAFKFVKDREKARELIQETFLSLWEHRSTVDETYPVGSLLFTITRRLTLNVFRSSMTHQAACREILQNMQEQHNETEEAIFTHDLERLANETIARLSKQQQLVFNLSRNEGLTHQEIASQLHISKNTVRNHMVEALKVLRRDFSKSDVVFTLFFACTFFFK